MTVPPRPYILGYNVRENNKGGGGETEFSMTPVLQLCVYSCSLVTIALEWLAGEESDHVLSDDDQRLGIN